MTATWAFEAIGTRFEIDAPRALSLSSREAIVELSERFDREWSRFRADSVVRGIARGGRAPAPPDAVAMLDALARAADVARGAMSPLIGDSLEALGYDPAYSLRAGDPAPAPAWRGTLTWHDGELALARPGVIDVGALGKGRLVDRITELVGADLRGEPVIVDGSGDMRIVGGPVRVALEHPFNPQRAIGVWEVTDASIAASAVNRRAWPGHGEGEVFHHVLDGRTGLPVRDVVATWAVAPTAMTADLVATALFFDGGDDLASEHGAEWVRVLSSGVVEASASCTAELFRAAAGVSA
ncbi:FAD:protein FMN transferase [uncultured Microbacterium sp.]|uniref:FAD:protein FMN transferase n=1 Tax=uncultured Microbacterium sp. TaxID=191216 RepID=UPI0025E0D782|nr:FAD:protein FMN transferase [uncultured Microbacterium sp.]